MRRTLDCPEPPDERSLYRVHEDSVGDDGALAQGTVLRYRCGAGYASSGRISVWNVTCTRTYDGVLYWVLPNHDCRPISCGHPGDVRHGRLLGAVFSFPNRVTYECDTGYQLVGTADLYCQSDGNWDAQVPECRKVTCPAPEPPEGGTSDISKDSGPQRLGTVVRYSCPQHLVLVGSRSSTCLSVGVWSFDPPKCKPPCEVPKLGNTLIVEEKTHGWGKRKYLQRGGGHETNTYRADEDPSEIGSSAKFPELRSCKFPEREIRFYAANGNVRVLPNDNVTHGTVLRFHCRPLGEIRLGGNEWSRCNNGTWSNEVPYCYGPGQYDAVISLKDTAGTAVSPDGYLNIDPRFEVEMECESYYYHPRLEIIEPLSTWKRGGVRSILKKIPYKNHYVSAKFILPEDYEGILRCSNDQKYPTQIIKIRGRYLHSCKIPAHLGATVVTRVNKEIATVKCKPPYVLRGEARAVCLAHSEWEKPFPECVLPAPLSVSNEPENVNMQSAKPVLEQTTEIPRLKGLSNPNCKILPMENVVYRREVDTSSREIQLDKEFANGTFIYYHCRGDRTSYRIRCLEGFWKPAPRCPPGNDTPAAATSHGSNEEQ
ncbi:hypothetical protein HPB47_015332, partial [Ixodes persulcatus]